MPVDLRERFGAEYRIMFDPVAVIPSERRDPWMMQIPCAGEGVTIYPHGETTLAVECDRRPGVARQLAMLPGVEITQHGGFGGEMTFVFPVERFDEVAAIAKPRRKRKLPEASREAFRAGREKGLATLVQSGNQAALAAEVPSDDPNPRLRHCPRTESL